MERSVFIIYFFENSELNRKPELNLNFFRWAVTENWNEKNTGFEPVTSSLLCYTCLIKYQQSSSTGLNQRAAALRDSNEVTALSWRVPVSAIFGRLTCQIGQVKTVKVSKAAAAPSARRHAGRGAAAAALEAPARLLLVLARLREDVGFLDHQQTHTEKLARAPSRGFNRGGNSSLLFRFSTLAALEFGGRRSVFHLLRSFWFVFLLFCFLPLFLICQNSFCSIVNMF